MIIASITPLPVSGQLNLTLIPVMWIFLKILSPKNKLCVIYWGQLVVSRVTRDRRQCRWQRVVWLWVIGSCTQQSTSINEFFDYIPLLKLFHRSLSTECTLTVFLKALAKGWRLFLQLLLTYGLDHNTLLLLDVEHHVAGDGEWSGLVKSQAMTMTHRYFFAFLMSSK